MCEVWGFQNLRNLEGCRSFSVSAILESDGSSRGWCSKPIWVSHVRRCETVALRWTNTLLLIQWRFRERFDRWLPIYRGKCHMDWPQAISWGPRWSAGPGTKGAWKGCVQRHAFCHPKSGHRRVNVLCCTFPAGSRTVTEQSGWLDFPEGTGSLWKPQHRHPLNAWDRAKKLFWALYHIVLIFLC